MKKRFESEIKKTYPKWYEELDDNPPPKQCCVRRTPAYVLPMFLTLVALGAYVVIAFESVKKNYWNNELAVVAVENDLGARISDNESRINESQDMLNLIAILHNENFAALRNATGTQDLMFLGPDWKIDRMPRHLKLTEKQKKMFSERFLRKPMTEKGKD